MQRHSCGLSSVFCLCGTFISVRLALCGPKMQSNKNSRCFQLEARTGAGLPRWKSQHMHECADFMLGILQRFGRCIVCPATRFFPVSIFAYRMRWWYNMRMRPSLHVVICNKLMSSTRFKIISCMCHFMIGSSLQDVPLLFSGKTLKLGETWVSVGRRPNWQVMTADKLIHIPLTACRCTAFV